MRPPKGLQPPARSLILAEEEKNARQRESQVRVVQKQHLEDGEQYSIPVAEAVQLPLAYPLRVIDRDVQHAQPHAAALDGDLGLDGKAVRVQLHVQPV